MASAPCTALAATTAGGQACAWRVLEGCHCYNPSTGCSTSGKTMPVLEYAHDSGRCAVTGG